MDQGPRNRYFKGCKKNHNLKFEGVNTCLGNFQGLLVNKCRNSHDDNFEIVIFYVDITFVIITITISSNVIGAFAALFVVNHSVEL